MQLRERLVKPALPYEWPKIADCSYYRDYEVCNTCKGNGAQEMGSTPYPGTIQDLTFNLFSILADNRLLANALFWITVWITAKVHGPWTTDRGY